MTHAASVFRSFFKHTTRNVPYDYQFRFATEDELPDAVQIPTGLGKTAALVLGWSWRRRFAKTAIREATPRRLVYCLPMRVLVEQTVENCVRWLDRLGLLAGRVEWTDERQSRLIRYLPAAGDANSPSGWAAEHGDEGPRIAVHVLMGGEDAGDWDIYPDRDAILVGTQDMLLSRALNRGYAMSRYRWPVQFGLLHNDSLWVFDEIQLMGSGLATTAQMEAFRKDFWPSALACRSIWMSATLEREWLRTVDCNDPGSFCLLNLGKDDLQLDELRRRFRAKKPIAKAKHVMDDAAGLAKEILDSYRPSTRTLTVVNTVARARDLYAALEKSLRKAEQRPEIVLIHSRFRPTDRLEAVRRLLADPGQDGTIVVSTQVIEAGVDVSARTLFTELAPWASLVQRFGRCNRTGTDTDARVYWIDLPSGKKSENAASPYDLKDLEFARKHLRKCTGVGPADLPEVELAYEHRQVLRSKDLLELFDTTPDLAGNDIDIDRYVREIESSDVQVFWRDWEEGRPPAEDMPSRQELCPVPVGEFKEFLKTAQKANRIRRAYRWDFLERTWVAAAPGQVYPGQIYLLHVSAGGYSARTGWDAKIADLVVPTPSPVAERSPEANEDDRGSENDRWQSIAEHTDEVCRELETILHALKIDRGEPLRVAARWHDRGKAHRVFQERILERRGDQVRPVVWVAPQYGAKAPGKKKQTGDPGWWAPRYSRRHFRHELASALAVLLAPEVDIPPGLRDLVAYLVAAHHGKVRLSIRSLPGEQPPNPRNGAEGHDRRFARGLWDDDMLPATDLSGVIAPEVRLSLEPMELGQCESPPFVGQPSWAERMLRLRDQLGPFRLAFLEALLRAADSRASRARNRVP